MHTKEQKLWEIADSIKLGSKVRLYNILEEALKQEIKLSYDDIINLNKRLRIPEFIVPQLISSFVAEYLSSMDSKSILNPWTRIGDFLYPVVATTNAKKVTGFILSEQEYEIAKILKYNIPINLKLGFPLDLLDESSDIYDVIISCPPFGYQQKYELLDADNHKVLIRDDISKLLILKSCQCLAEDGVAFFVVPNSFFSVSKKNNVRNVFSRFGLYFDAIFALPPGVFAPITSIPTNLIVLRKIQYQKTFIAELKPGHDIKPIINNWRQRKFGKLISLGSLIEIEKFISYYHLHNMDKIKNITQKRNLEPILLRDISIEINYENKKIENGFEEKENTIYLPLIGKSIAINKISDFKIKPQNYVQIVLDENKASAEYVAYFFNSELGYLVRENMTTSFSIPKVSKYSIDNAIVYLPPKRYRKEVLKLQTEINDLQRYFNNLQKQLWNKPYNYNEVNKSLKIYRHKERVEDWIEELPFPLASILWRYFATDNFFSKKEHLFHFFEAVTIFNAMIMLSALLSDMNFFEKYCSHILNDENIRLLKKSSFGTWLKIDRELASISRTELSKGNEYRERLVRMYRCRRVNFIEKITNKNVYIILEKVSNYRNDWKGHNGIENHKLLLNHVELLEIELKKLKEYIMDWFENMLILKRQVDKSYSQGVFTYVVTALMGTRSIFKEQNIYTTIPLESNILYLAEIETEEPLRLIPLMDVILASCSEENACYFYNKITDKGERWISYHYEKESEINICNNMFIEYLQTIKNGFEKSK